MFDCYDHLAPRFTLVCMVMPASASMPSIAFENGINEGQLYQWVRKYNIQSMSRKGNGYGKWQLFHGNILWQDEERDVLWK